ncbi:S-crystallin, Glutathione S-transferase (GST) [Artemisia annua]|uniref:glutathione transferase n=1 Tax=Artemisia annua TaxID=35608 RepID=A0A2U1LLC2_ARTAN|nr:S-crystallin, Glutathione S-transferase (GST) [Artemisia annua]
MRPPYYYRSHSLHHLAFIPIHHLVECEIKTQILRFERFEELQNREKHVAENFVIGFHNLPVLFSSSATCNVMVSYLEFERNWQYPSDLIERSKVHSVLDWHHGNLRRGSVGVLVSTIFGPLKGVPSSPQAIEESEKALAKSLSIIEDFWLKDGPFLVGRSQPSIADLNLVSEVMELELLDKKQHERIFSPFKKVVKWVEDTRSATAPYFDEVHEKLFKSKIGIQESLAAVSRNLCESVTSHKSSISVSCDMLRLLGYKEEVMFYHFKIPNTSLDDGLRPLITDTDVKEMIKHIGTFKVIEVFIELWLTVFPNPLSQTEGKTKSGVVEVTEPKSKTLQKLPLRKKNL